MVTSVGRPTVVVESETGGPPSVYTYADPREAAFHRGMIAAHQRDRARAALPEWHDDEPEAPAFNPRRPLNTSRSILQKLSDTFTRDRGATSPEQRAKDAAREEWLIAHRFNPNAPKHAHLEPDEARALQDKRNAADRARRLAARKVRESHGERLRGPRGRGA